MKLKRYGISCFIFIVCATGQGCNAQCPCDDNPAVKIRLVNEDGSTAYADNIEYSHDGEMASVPNSDLDNKHILIWGPEGTYQFIFTIERILWESKEIEVELVDPDSCESVRTKQLSVFLGKNELTSEVEILGSECE